MTYPHGGASNVYRDQKGAAGVIEQPTRPDGSAAQETDAYNPPKDKLRDIHAHTEAAVEALQAQAFAADPIYADTTAGLAATSEGDQFKVQNADPLIAFDVFEHDAGGVATLVASVPQATLISDVQAGLVDKMDYTFSPVAGPTYLQLLGVTYDANTRQLSFPTSGTNIVYSEIAIAEWFQVGDRVNIRLPGVSANASAMSRVRAVFRTSADATLATHDLTWDASEGAWTVIGVEVPSNTEYVFFDLRNATSGEAIDVGLPEIVAGLIYQELDADRAAVLSRQRLEQRNVDALPNYFDQAVLSDPNINNPTPALNADGELVLPDNRVNRATITFGTPVSAGQQLLFSCFATALPTPGNFDCTLTYDDATTETVLPRQVFGDRVAIRMTAARAVTQAQIEVRGPITLSAIAFTVGTHILPDKTVIDTATKKVTDALSNRVTVLESTATDAEAERFEIESRVAGGQYPGWQPKFSALAAEALSRIMSFTPIQYFVDGIDGDDSTGTGARAAPWATCQHADDTIAEATDFAVFVQTPHAENQQPRIKGGHRSSLVGMGAGQIAFDSRIDLSAASWALEAGTADVWKTTATLTDAPTAAILNGDAANSYHPCVWYEDAPMLYVVGGANIAANIASIDAASSGFTVHFTGSTEEDLRDDEANTTTSVEVYVKVPGGGTPAGLDLRMTDFFGSASIGFNQAIGDCVTQGIRYVGNYGKDSFTSQASKVGSRVQVPTHINMEIVDGSSHGNVGPCHSFGRYRFRGRPVSPRTLETGRSDGGGMHLYYDSNDDIDQYLLHEYLDLENVNHAVYSHGGAGTGRIKGLEIGYLRAVNIGTVVNTGGIMLDTIVHQVFAKQASRGFFQRHLTVNGGFFETATFAQDPSRGRSLTDFGSTSEVLKQTFRNLAMRNLLGPDDVNDAFANLIGVSAAPSGQLHEVTFDNCWDHSAPDRCFAFLKVGDNGTPLLRDVHVILTNGTKLGDLKDRPDRDGFAKKITAAAGTRFNYGGAATVAELRTSLTSIGVVHDISDDVVLATARHDQ